MERSAFGTDRLRVGKDGTAYLSCLAEKEGWVARRPAGHVHREFPGTCVQWEGELFEVTRIDELPLGVRYSLGPWNESHTIRTIVDYDEASEVKREDERREERSRHARAARFSLFGIVTGLLPAERQLRIQRELGVSAQTSTIISSISLFMVGVASVFAMAGAKVAGSQLALPLWAHLLGSYFLFESLVRFTVVLAQSTAIGSFPVVLTLEIVDAMRGKKSLRANEPRLKWELDQATLGHDAYTLREPFLAFLSPPEQRLLEERYGFDWRARGKSSAILLLIFAIFVAATTLPAITQETATAGNWITLLMMSVLGGEQVGRLRRIAAGDPAGSFLGPLVRPFSRKLMD
jgi:hypothetical protein